MTIHYNIITLAVLNEPIKDEPEYSIKSKNMYQSCMDTGLFIKIIDYLYIAIFKKVYELFHTFYT